MPERETRTDRRGRTVAVNTYGASDADEDGVIRLDVAGFSIGPSGRPQVRPSASKKKSHEGE